MFAQRPSTNETSDRSGMVRVRHTLLVAAISLLICACSGNEEAFSAESRLNGPTPATYPQSMNAQIPLQTQGAVRPLAADGGQGDRSANGINHPRPALQGHSLRMQRVEIVDRQGFERPMVAATAMIPVGWRTQGGVVWKPTTCGNGYNFNWSASSPDGNRGIALFPGEQWSWSNFPVSGTNCPKAEVSSVKQFLQNLVGRARPGARIIDFRPREDLTKPYQQLNSVTPMGSGELRSWVEAGEILIGYSNARGVEIRETAAAVAFFNLSRMPGIYGDEMRTLSGQTLAGFAAYAPYGQLDFKADETMRKAIQAAPDWMAKISNHDAAIAKNTNETYRNIAKTNADGARQRSQLIAKTSAEISDMQMDTWRSKNELWDKQLRENGEMINEVETYDDPQSSTGAVQLSYDYKNAWRLDDGTYVLTDDANFQPYKDTGQYGQKLKVQE